MKIDADFAGGNICVEHLSEHEAVLRPDQRGNGVEWFYWCFRVRHAAPGRRVRFRFEGMRALAARGPAVSLDQGRSWSWLGPADYSANAFDYAFPSDAAEVRFSMGMPYLPERWTTFLAGLALTPLRLRPETLVVTAAGPVPALHVGDDVHPFP